MEQRAPADRSSRRSWSPSRGPPFTPRISPWFWYPMPVTSRLCPWKYRRVTVISFWVRVPVLSVQITVAQPRVSTAERRLIRAWRLAMRWTPMARDRVTVGRSPSGTKATIIPMEKTTARSRGVSTRKTEARKKRMPMLMAMAETCLVIRPISFCRGLSSSFISCVRLAIFPNSVAIPVEQITAFPDPALTVVPAKTILMNSARVRPSL